MKKLGVILIAVLFCLHSSVAQNDTVSIMLDQISSTKDDSLKSVLYADISWECYLIDDPDALMYARKGLNIAAQINNPKCLSYSYSQVALVHFSQDDFAEAIHNWNKALEYNEIIKNYYGIISNKSNIAGVYFNLENYALAEISYLELAKLAEEQGETVMHQTAVSNLAAVYGSTKRFKKANDAIRNLMKEYPDLVLDFNQENNLAEWAHLAGENERALALIDASIEAHQDESVHEYSVLIQAFMIRGSIKTDLGDNVGAEEDLQLALGMAKEHNNLIWQSKTYEKLSFHFKNLDQSDSALKYYEIHDFYEDSILSIENIAAVKDIDTKYQTKKKEAENVALKAQGEVDEITKSRQQVAIWAGSGGLLLFLIIAIQLMRSNRIKKKANEKILAQRDEIEEQKKDILDSIEYAKKIQNTILPSTDEIRAALHNAFVFYEPRDVVSGDFFFFHEKDDRVFIAACDCTGHGVPGAFVSMTCSNLIKKAVIDDDVNDPGQVLRSVNQGLHKAFKSGVNTAMDGMDMALACIHKDYSKVEFAGANNNLLLVRSEEISELKAERRPIGGRTELDFNFQTKSATPQKGDSFYLYSDGFPDQFGGPKGKKFMSRKFKILLSELASKSSQEKKSRLLKTLVNWQGDLERVDDVLVMGFEIP